MPVVRSAVNFPLYDWSKRNRITVIDSPTIALV